MTCARHPARSGVRPTFLRTLCGARRLAGPGSNRLARLGRRLEAARVNADCVGLLDVASTGSTMNSEEKPEGALGICDEWDRSRRLASWRTFVRPPAHGQRGNSWTSSPLAGYSLGAPVDSRQAGRGTWCLYHFSVDECKRPRLRHCHGSKAGWKQAGRTVPGWCAGLLSQGTASPAWSACSARSRLGTRHHGQAHGGMGHVRLAESVP